jgi:membrane-associated protease RseP (regulator of RpoE activity)
MYAKPEFRQLFRKVTALFLLLAVITLHEGGHFAACQLTDVAVDEFAVGFGPKLASIKLAGTEFSLRLLPLGGYNEVNLQAITKASLKKKVAIYLAGMLANVLSAFILLLLFSEALGRPQTEPRPQLFRWAFRESFGIWLGTPGVVLRERGNFFSRIIGPLQTISQVSSRPVTWKYYLWYFVSLSVGVASLNLIPLHPLDGGKFFTSLLATALGENSRWVVMYMVSTVLCSAFFCLATHHT